MSIVPRLRSPALLEHTSVIPLPCWRARLMSPCFLKSGALECGIRNAKGWAILLTVRFDLSGGSPQKPKTFTFILAAIPGARPNLGAGRRWRIVRAARELLSNVDGGLGAWGLPPSSSGLFSRLRIFSAYIIPPYILTMLFKKQTELNCPGWCGSVDWVLVSQLKGCWFDIRSGHMPGLWAGARVGGMREATSRCISHTLMFLSRPSPPSKNKYIKSFLKRSKPNWYV